MGNNLQDAMRKAIHDRRKELADNFTAEAGRERVKLTEWFKVTDMDPNRRPFRS